MGACLPTAVMATNIERHGTDRFTIAVAEVNGWRNSMEDAHVCVTKDNWGYFGILDGHGGTECSKWCAARLVKYLNSDGCPKTDAEAKALILKVRPGAHSILLLTGPAPVPDSEKGKHGGQQQTSESVFFWAEDRTDPKKYFSRRFSEFGHGNSCKRHVSLFSAL